ncbi:MAG: Crp/Fnr family transcriptional regulator, partial [Epsilonproteobacteria bacterium]|nr:Crp/Fnr family transcriptional regulator [Campylobacterota bacterium]
MSVIDAIKSQDFFSTLTDAQAEQLSAISSVCNYPKNYILYYEQKDTNELLFLSDGLAKAYKIDKHTNEIFLYYIYKNTLISEISDLKQDTIYSFSNVALVEESTVLSVNYKKFKELFIDKHILCKELTNEVIKRSLQLQTLVNREFIYDSVSKVAKMLDADLEMFNSLK